MAKEVKAKLKLQIPGGGATPAPPVGSALGQYGVNIMDFVQAFNNDTSSRQGETVPVEIVIYEDNSFSFETKTAPASYLIKKAIGLESVLVRHGHRLILLLDGGPLRRFHR